MAPLDRLLPIGTIVLTQHRLTADVQHELAEDGWLNLAKDSLEPVPDPAADPPVEPAPAPPPPAAPRRSSTTKAGSSSRSKKRRASSAAGGSSLSKKVKYSAHPHLDALLTLSAAHVLRATVRIVDVDVGEGEGSAAAALVRVYLVPQDLPELRGPGAVRARMRPPGSVVLGLLSAVRVHAGEWDGEVQSGDLPGFMAETVRPALSWPVALHGGQRLTPYSHPAG